ncbi:uncharacterized protein [Typha angustifolia]|uniref:uncharacterized protein n=1 Tax=Typha angustifolia TaxID=59011 RepID=UPI003C2B4C7D
MPFSGTKEVASPPPPGRNAGKRRRGRPPGSRAKKKQRRLDSIRDIPSLPTVDDDPSLLRRSSRVRRAPAVLDSSPVPSHRRKKPKRGESPSSVGSGGSRKRRRRKKKGRKKRGGDGREEGKMLSVDQNEADLASSSREVKDLEAEGEEWRSRLRSRVGKGREKAAVVGSEHLLRKSDRGLKKEEEEVKVAVSEDEGGSDSQALGSDAVEESADKAAVLPSNVHELSSGKTSPDEELREATDLEDGHEVNKEFASADQTCEIRDEAECMNLVGKEEVEPTVGEEAIIPLQESQNAGCEDHVETRSGEHPDDKTIESEDIAKNGSVGLPIAEDKLTQPTMKEGRRCGLCGGGTDGRPPKILIQESTESDHETYEGSLASEESNYDVWDGFGDDPGWLGRLLGPIHDRFGIARVWVHQHCAVWSPEVYFAGLGCLKNVRAALCRGRALKCSRCGRPGATIGCRVDRCPKTYHLPCSRAEGCIFDHRKFLIACNDHRHLFQPQGDDYTRLIRKMKAKMLKLDMRKISHDACRKDLESEEKWLENCGEDEEFLKREGKRLHRDLVRIAPVYIGGSSENEKLNGGWESVAGLKEVIQCMKEVVILPLLYPEFFSTLGLSPPRGVLLHGYPGTGKTLVVRALIGACSRGNKRIAYFARKGADCLGKYVGDAERQLRLLFQVAEKSQPSIIFFDEIDGLAPCRSRQQDQTHNSVVSTLLSLLDGLKSRGSVIVIGATNRPDAVDPALRRPGRFDREIYFPLPTLKDRSSILSLHTKSWPNPVSASLLSLIANQTAGYAGADLQALCTQAAMNALKRNCALQKLMSSAEKGNVHGRLPSLPSFVVEERDWLAALSAAPPPCSRREAGMAANDIVSSPLDSHLLPCLLKPLLYLLISVHMDERIWLPSSLVKASKSIKDVIDSALEHKGIPVILWRSHLPSLIQEQYIASEIIRILSRYGLVTGNSGSNHSKTPDDDNGNYENFDVFRSKPSDSCLYIKSLRKSSGFRVLITGAPRSGQQHLASCLLHGFIGQIEIQKVNLATMSQEGYGDIIRGLTQILLKCLNVGRCVIYMPRLDLWAIDEFHEPEGEHCEIPQTIKSPPQEGTDDRTRIPSEAWNSFIEQVDSVCASATMIILATCEMEIHQLPHGIRQFFTKDVLDQTASCVSEHTVPRFSLAIDGNYNLDQVINSCASKLSKDLVQQYVQLVHHRSHGSNSNDQSEVTCTGELYSEDEMHDNRIRQATASTETPGGLERLASNSVASCRDSQPQLSRDSQQGLLPYSNIKDHQTIHVQHHGHPELVSRNIYSKVVKGNLMLAIATFGYQILRYPQFAELCWLTSKLKEGPCTDINGPWKGWPFNTCLIHESGSPEKIISGVNNNIKDKEQSGVVRGLVAVGLLAYRGVYTSVTEVSCEVRKVLEHLIGRIRGKILEKKDRYCYLHILSQVAYLEDIVNSWAFTLQSSHADNQTAASNSKPTILGKLGTNDDLNGRYPADKISGVANAPKISCNEVQEVPLQQSPHKVVTSNGGYAFSDNTLPNSDASVILEAETVPVAQCNIPSSTLSPQALVNVEISCRSESPIPKSCECTENSNDLQRTEITLPFTSDISIAGSLVAQARTCNTEVSGQCKDSDRVPLKDIESVSDARDMVTGLEQQNKNVSVVSKISCLYGCCHDCVHVVYMLVHNILSSSWRSNGHLSTLDDIHDVLTSCSLNLLTAIRKCYISQDLSNCEEICGSKQLHRVQSECCACQKNADKDPKRMLFQHKVSKSTEFSAKECDCHLMNKEDTGTTNTTDAESEPVLSFYFRDGVLMPLNLQEESTLHCRFERLCVSSILEMIYLTGHPTD